MPCWYPVGALLFVAGAVLFPPPSFSLPVLLSAHLLANSLPAWPALLFASAALLPVPCCSSPVPFSLPHSPPPSPCLGPPPQVNEQVVALGMRLVERLLADPATRQVPTPALLSLFYY